jgi:hypothetical protein
MILDHNNNGLVPLNRQSGLSVGVMGLTITITIRGTTAF